jgi:hypothetical protein
MNAAPARLDDWISPARFDHEYGAAGLDIDFGTAWGVRENQRVSLRIHPDGQHGVLYAYDPLWNECLVIDAAATRAEVSAAFQTVLTRRGDRGVALGVFADAVRRRQLEPLFAAGAGPRTLGALGIEP